MAANVKPKNNQDAFDKVLKAIRKQNYQRSVNTDGACKYRGPNGLRCAAGHLIPNSLYKVSIEGLSISNNKMPDEVKNYFDAVSMNLIQDMQFAHDNNLEESITAWEIRMKEIANNYGLTYTEASKEI